MDIEKQIVNLTNFMRNEPDKYVDGGTYVKHIEHQASIISQQKSDIERLIDGMRRISECGVTGEDARDMHWIAREFI